MITNSSHKQTRRMDSKSYKHLLALEEMNRVFYEKYASSFHSTREYGWRGWRALLNLLQSSSLTVLDIACGNGRLADFLDRVWVNELENDLQLYTGLERSSGLLDQAKKRTLNFSVDWREFDWSNIFDRSKTLLEQQDLKYSWVTLFGVLHHVYSFELRTVLIEQAVQVLEVGGYLSISLWNFGAQERYQKKFLPWSHFLKENSGLSLDCVEEGDFLLGWSGESHIPRFCHWQSSDEEQRWFCEIARRIPELSKPILVEVEGDQNRYWSWYLTRPLNPT